MKLSPRVPSLIIIALLSLLSFSSAAQGEGKNPEKQKATLFKTWRYMDGGDEEIIIFSPDKFQSRIGGAGLPRAGLEMEKPIAKIIPNPNAKEGMIILGPDETQSQPYKAIHWFDLSSDEVKLFLCPFVFPSVGAAIQESKCDKKYFKTYRALPWGI